MDKEKAQLLLGLSILGGFVFIYCLDLFLGIRAGVSRGNWLPCVLVAVCTLYAGGQWWYLHLKKKEEEERRRKPPSDDIRKHEYI